MNWTVAALMGRDYGGGRWEYQVEIRSFPSQAVVTYSEIRRPIGRLETGEEMIRNIPVPPSARQLCAEC